MKIGKRAALLGAGSALVLTALASAPASATTKTLVHTDGKRVPTTISRPAIHLGAPTGAPKASIPIEYSGNWAGYIALPKSGKATAFKSVSANYEVPSVNCNVTNYAFSYHWVGLDGWTDGTVEQDGVGSFCINGSPYYFAWYEMYPAGNIQEFTVNPGDSIDSSVVYAASTGEYTLALNDITTGQNFSVNETCASTCSNASAEVITEGYASSPYGGTADFGTEHYGNVRVVDSANKEGGLVNGNWSTDESISQGASGSDDDVPGPIATSSTSPHQSFFEINWAAEN